MLPLALVGCVKVKPPVPDVSPSASSTPAPPTLDLTKIRPDELGKIPVIMYHEIGKSGKNKDLDRTITSFEQDLQLLYDKGFYLVNTSDIVTDNLNVPAGKSPVALTFDDARKTQFTLIETEKGPQVDPNCALGILERFVKAHPDWKLHATFFILPKSKTTMESFGQIGMGKDKIDYLLKNGCEIANHSIQHKTFAAYTSAQLQAEVGGADKLITDLNPEAKLQVFALPMGKYPKNKTLWPLLLKGSFNGHNYSYQAAFDAAWRPIPSPSSKKYNPLRLERINSIDTVNGVRDWIQKLSAPGGGRYVSDGDPNWVSFPKEREADAALDRLQKQGKQVNAYTAKPGSGGGGIQSAADALVAASPKPLAPPKK